MAEAGRRGVISVEAVTGRAIERWLGALAELRIGVFREYPYLYAGTHDYERSYLARYAASPQHFIVLARDGDRVVGAATAMPLAASEPEVIAALAGFADTFYFGESVLERGYRGRGIGHRFFDAREAHARSCGATTLAFCAVDRPADHPRRPPDYVSHDAFWTRRGYARRPDLTATFTWRDLDDVDETAKPMTFWISSL
ncbi:MAG: GNAT family N-acetyltransferase [Kofleriaceae bacterium]